MEEEEQKITLPLTTYIRSAQTLERQAAEIYQLKDLLEEINEAAKVIQLELDELKKAKPIERKKRKKENV